MTLTNQSKRSPSLVLLEADQNDQAIVSLTTFAGMWNLN
jgi:hypothetical protein